MSSSGTHAGSDVTRINQQNVSNMILSSPIPPCYVSRALALRILEAMTCQEPPSSPAADVSGTALFSSCSQNRHPSKRSVVIPNLKSSPCLSEKNHLQGAPRRFVAQFLNLGLRHDVLKAVSATKAPRDFEGFKL